MMGEIQEWRRRLRAGLAPYMTQLADPACVALERAGG